MVKRVLICFLVLAVAVLSLIWFASEELALWRVGIHDADCLSEYTEEGTTYAVYCGNDGDGGPLLVRLKRGKALLWSVDVTVHANEKGYAELAPRNEGPMNRQQKDIWCYIYCGPFDTEKVREVENINNYHIGVSPCGENSGVLVLTLYPQRWEEREITQLFKDP